MIRLLLVLPLLLAGVGLCAQEFTGPFEPLWYGSSYLSFPKGKGLLLEGAIAPSYEIGDISSKNENRFSVRVVVTPEVLFQMSGEKSSPIRTPSYKPRVAFLGAWPTASFTLNPFLVLGHHSNGQDGSLLDSASHHIDTKSGTFSTNYVHTGYYVSLADLPGHMTGVSFEFHPSKGWFSIDRNIQELYGRKRFSYSYLYLRKNVRLEALYTRILDKPSGVPGRIYSAKLKWRVPGFRKMVWLFANYYEGQNYYNIFFGEKLRQFKAGLSIDAKFVGNKLVQID